MSYGKLDKSKATPAGFHMKAAYVTGKNMVKKSVAPKIAVGKGDPSGPDALMKTLGC